MSSVTNPRGPLPSRVYWFRRLLAVGLALALVFAVSRLFAGDAQQSETPTARPAAAAPGSASAGLRPSASALPTQGPTREPDDEIGKKDEKTKTPLAIPSGPCDDADVKVTPLVDDQAYAVHDVTITLNLSTLESPACTWDVSAESVVLKVTSGTDPIWTTQDCQGAIPDQSVVVRKDHTTQVEVSWSGQRSDDGCTTAPTWALPGFYHASSAAYGGEPEAVQFELRKRAVTTLTPEPKKNQT